ncbi:NAD-dependent epimerase/dehydratase family protein [Bradyrhizobium sp.]|jgi:UDP-glucose 4-epimerase|uniref:NAD-dependent epimerase/dehydratase family protein n=1 Tax=Bradyrhizobium sp. TaxID=376 RepID=UPI003BB206D5
MTVWITGANGFIGRYLVRQLADAEAVHGLGHGAFEESDRRRLGLQTWLNGEIDAANLNALLVAHGPPSKVFHLAGGSSVGLSIELPLEDFSRTVASTARLLEWLRSSAPACLLVVTSSAAVYGADHVGPIAENATLAPMSPYGHHKLMMEQLCESYALSFGLRSVVVRLFSVYGANLRKQLLWDMCSRLSQGGPPLFLGGTGAETRDWTDVRDVVRLLARLGDLLPEEHYRVINGGSGRAIRVADIAELLVKNFGLATTVSYSGVARRGDPHSLLADDSALRHLGFEWRIPVERGIADYVNWFKGQARG